MIGRALICPSAFSLWFLTTASVLAQSSFSGSPIPGAQSLSRFGAAVRAVADIDGDSVADLVIGAPYENGAFTEAGRVYLYSGADRSTLLGTFDGTVAYAHAGAALAIVGDVDQDGKPEIAVGAPNHSGSAGANQGAVAVVSGATMTALYWITIDEAGAELGTSIDGAADLDGDGILDLIAGAAYAGADQGGAALWFALHALDASLVHRIDGAVAYEHMGRSIAHLGDANNDGFDDYLVGSPDYDGAYLAMGKVIAVSGDSSQSYPVLRTMLGSAFLEQFGWAVGAVNDPDGQFGPHALISAVGYSTFSLSRAGAVFVYHVPTGSISRLVEGTDRNQYFGHSVCAIGDQDSDGYEDFAVGAPLADDEGTESGIVDIISGHGTGVLGESLYPLYRIRGRVDQRFGESLARLGDLNGDGCEDFAVGLIGYKNPSSSTLEVGGVDVHRSSRPRLTTDKYKYVENEVLSVSGVGPANSVLMLMAGTSLSPHPNYQISFADPHVLIFGLGTDSFGNFEFNGSIPSFSGLPTFLYLQCYIVSPAAKLGRILFSEVAAIAVNSGC